MTAPKIHRLTVERFRGIKKLTWLPAEGANFILGGGDSGKTTILDAIALLLSPTNSSTLSDADYYARNLDEGFYIEAVISLPPETVARLTLKPSWPWEWKDGIAQVPTIDDESNVGELVYLLRVTGTPDLELLYEIVQPNLEREHLSVRLRRSIGVIRLTGDDRNDRDLRLVYGSALDRLLSDPSLRSRLGNKLSHSDVKAELLDDAKQAMINLDHAFTAKALPTGLDLAVTGAQGVAITALIGLTAVQEGVQLPLSSWGSGTRRLSALTVAEQIQSNASIILVDEIERGLEPYRQHHLVERMQASVSQSFITTHSAAALSAATSSTIWYLDHRGAIGVLDGSKISAHLAAAPEAFLSRLTIVAEGETEVGFVSALLEKALNAPLQTHGIVVTNGNGHETTLNLLEALSTSGLKFGGFADDERGQYPDRWRRVQDRLGALLFRWEAGCIEENLIAAVPIDRMNDLIAHPQDGSGNRLRTLAVRLGCQDKALDVLRAQAGDRFVQHIVEAALGTVPVGKLDEKKTYKSHASIWFKSIEGGREIAHKIFSLNLWPHFKPKLLPFLNASRVAVGLSTIEDLEE